MNGSNGIRPGVAFLLLLGAGVLAAPGCAGPSSIQMQSDFRPCPGDGCPVCAGSRQVTCPACRGEPQRPCLDCNQTGVVACDSCTGKGLFQRGRTLDCTRCSGTGTIPCPRCRGSSLALCNKCRGSGKVPCSTVVVTYRCEACGTVFPQKPATCPTCGR